MFVQIILLCLLFAGTLLANKDLDDSISGSFGFYWQTDQPDHSGGNPKLDEDEFVFEGIILLDKSLTEKDRIQAKFITDIISSASETRNQNAQFRALQANASGNKRFAGDIGYSHYFEDFGFQTHAGYSVEINSYNSWVYGLRFWVSTANNNTTWIFKLDGATDYFQVKLYDGTADGFSYRQSIPFEVTLQQVLTPLDLISLCANYTPQFGTLQTTYYSVFLGDTEQAETMPNTRHRGALGARWKHSLTENNATELGYRFYLDSWNIMSHTAEAKYSQYLGHQQWLLEPSVRFHTQNGAHFFERQFFGVLPIFRTSDTDLGPFTGVILGLKAYALGWPLAPSLGVNYWIRNDGFQIGWFDVGFATFF